MPATDRWEPRAASASAANGETLPANGTLEFRLAGPGSQDLLGQVKSTGSYSVDLVWMDLSGIEFRTETGINGGTQTADTWMEVNRAALSPFVELELHDESAADQTADGLFHVA